MAACSFSTSKDEAGGSPRVQGQFGLQTETMSQEYKTTLNTHARTRARTGTSGSTPWSLHPRFSSKYKAKKSKGGLKENQSHRESQQWVRLEVTSQAQRLDFMGAETSPMSALGQSDTSAHRPQTCPNSLSLSALYEVLPPRALL